METLIWTHTMFQVMVCCLTVPRNYENRCWLMIIGALWHPPKTISQGLLKVLISRVHLPGASKLRVDTHWKKNYEISYLSSFLKRNVCQDFKKTCVHISQCCLYIPVIWSLWQYYPEDRSLLAVGDLYMSSRIRQLNPLNNWKHIGAYSAL